MQLKVGRLGSSIADDLRNAGAALRLSSGDFSR